MSYTSWSPSGLPPRDWARTLAIDVGGASPWCFLWCALDPQGYLVAYEEVYLATTDVEKLVNLAKPHMKHPEGEYPNWMFKCCDYENRVAMEDLRRRGIVVTNAVKTNKVASIHRLASYLHPNPKRPFPSWHPKAGKPGSPLLFVMNRCKNLIRELPQQRWKEGQGDNLKDEADRNIDNHAVDALLYTVRLLPHASEVKITAPVEDKKGVSLQSRLYWADVRRKEQEKQQAESRRPYRPGHLTGGSRW